MSKAAPWTNHEVELDVREAARHAARREGLSVGEWLDRIVIRRAAAKGIAASDLTADERLDAVTEQLMRLARDRPQQSQSAERILANFESDRRRNRVFAADQQPAPAARNLRDRGIIDLLKPAPRTVEEKPDASPSGDDLGQLMQGESPEDVTEPVPTTADAAQPQPAVSEQVGSWSAGPDNADEARAASTSDSLIPPVAAVPAEPDPAFDAFGDGADQMSQVEAKLTALFRALDTTPGRTSRRPPIADMPAAAPAEAITAEAEGPEPALAELDVAPPAFAERPPVVTPRSHTLMQGTTLSSPPSLEQAIAEISDRQAFLERAAETDPATAPTDVRSTAGNLLHRYGLSRLRRRAASEPSSFPEAADRSRIEPLETSWSEPFVAPSAPATIETPPSATSSRPGASDFVALQAEISSLAKRLEDIHRDSTGRDRYLAKEASVGEVLARLDGKAQGLGLETLEHRVETLAAKIDSAIETRLRPAAIEDLASRIEEMRSSMAAGLGRTADTGALEQKIDGLVGSIDAMQRNAVDATALDGMMQGLAARLDDARRPDANTAVFSELQAQLGKLVERVDHSDAGLAAIVAVERSLGELFTQLEETREAAINAAETAARTAARDTLRAAMLEAPLPAQAQGTAEAAVANITQQIADLRATRETADKRLHSMLTTLNKTLEKVVDRLTLDPVSTGAPARGAPAEQVLDLAETSGLVAPADMTQFAADAVAVTGDRTLGAIDLDEADFPIEPGSGPARGRPQSRKPSSDVSKGGEVRTDPAQFIAAARRAAQAASKEAMARSSASAARRAGTAPEVEGQSVAERATSFVAQRRRPLLLALAGVVLLLGAAQLARLALRQPETVSVGDASTAPAAEVATSDSKQQIADASAPRQDTVPTVASGTDAAKVDDAAKPAEATPPTSTPVTTAAVPAQASASPASVPDAADTVTTGAVPAPLDAVRSLPTLAMGFGAKRPAAGDLQNGIPAGLRDLAQAGNAPAEYEVGLRMADGRGVSRDLKGAADWFDKAAKQGLAPAAYRLGSLYEKGLGVARDAALSTQWYQKAADQGNVRAMHNLAVMSAEGAGGKSDYARAATWFTKAAQSGVRDSQFNLAILYARGLGVEQNLAQSYTWFAIAANQGDADAAKKRDEVATRLDAKALASAKAAAEQFQPTPLIGAANEVKAPPGGWDAVAPTAATAPTSGKVNGGAHFSSM